MTSIPDASGSQHSSSHKVRAVGSGLIRIIHSSWCNSNDCYDSVGRDQRFTDLVLIKVRAAGNGLGLCTVFGVTQWTVTIVWSGNYFEQVPVVEKSDQRFNDLEFNSKCQSCIRLGVSFDYSLFPTAHQGRVSGGMQK